MIDFYWYSIKESFGARSSWFAFGATLFDFHTAKIVLHGVIIVFGIVRIATLAIVFAVRYGFFPHLAVDFGVLI